MGLLLAISRYIEVPEYQIFVLVRRELIDGQVR
jgi:hypothetical protein